MPDVRNFDTATPRDEDPYSAMTARNYKPVNIVAFKSKAHLVRQVAAEHGIEYDEAPVLGEEDVIRFSFKKLDDSAGCKIVLTMPLEVFAPRAVIFADPPRGNPKKTP